MARSTLPLFPTDDGWPYPDATAGPEVAGDGEPDLDALELRADARAFAVLTARERAVVFGRFGLDGRAPRPLKELAPQLGCTRAEARVLLGDALGKLRAHLAVR